MLTVNYSLLGLVSGDTLLDLGCGGGRHTFEALKYGASVIPFDSDSEALAAASSMVRAMRHAGEISERVACSPVKGDALALPFENETFDRIIASEVLEHVHDDMQAMAELHRVLKPHGVLAVTVPRFGPEVINWHLAKAYHRHPGGHIRIYARPVLLDRLERSGMTPIASHYAHGLHSPYWWLRCAVGPDNDTHPMVHAYHRLLVWDITKRPWLTRYAERLLAPLIGKSMVVYAKKSRLENRPGRHSQPVLRDAGTSYE
ncbi:MAG: class I SAM-dependent methyltransferase [Acidimicrobiales bacterium]